MNFSIWIPVEMQINRQQRNSSKEAYIRLEIEGSLKFATFPVPQQANMQDRALYVLKFTTMLAIHTGEWTATNLEILDAVTPASITEFRKKLLQLIESKRS